MRSAPTDHSKALRKMDARLERLARTLTQGMPADDEVVIKRRTWEKFKKFDHNNSGTPGGARR